MTIRVALNHKTEYRYDRAVTLLPQMVRLRPAPHCRTPILSYSLNVHPRPHFLNWQQDPYSNYVARIVFPELAREMVVEVDLVAEMTSINPFDFFIEASAEHYPFAYEPVLGRELLPYLETQPGGPKFQALVGNLRWGKVRTIDHLVEINRRVHGAVGYVIRMEPGIQTCEDTLTLRIGSCRDSAWLLVQVLRHLGLAARFVSGYLIQLSADVKALDGPPGPANDFTDLHAWAEVYVPGAGWIGLDPTSGLLVGEGHIPLACTADPVSAAPITGSFEWSKGPLDGDAGACRQDFSFHMSVMRIHEDPRVTRPYSEGQWLDIDAVGRRVDDELRRLDVRLTMGGEPTFVSMDDREDPEWNTVAQGPHKRRLAGILLQRLRQRFAPGGLLHFGQGKWYPGESLPRWALTCYWRRDGVSIWQEPGLVAYQERNYQHGEAEAWQFINTLSAVLGVAAANCLPGYEDVWYYLWKERRLPVNVDPLENRLEDPEERQRLARVFDHGLSTVIGYALPLRPGDPDRPPRWRSSHWLLRRERLYLIPGDAAMGYRLPLDTLPWQSPEDRDAVIDLDPFAPRAPLPPRREAAGQQHIPPVAQEPGSPGPGGRRWPGDPGRDGRPDIGVVRTALCVEPREGRLHVFMPPLRDLEDYLDLVAAIEATATTLNLPVLIEGYPPPHDDRLNVFKLTPDPGVLEVNLQPAHGWKELVKNTTILYEEAHQSRLTTDKFLLDGRHVGTGGGNHVLIGGPTPADSPILRRPDLLRSLLGYWHNHPSLSYLFTGLFIGPTSQAPRVDEARNDSLYELELAFQQVPDGGDFPPWLVDRIFRHLLIDATGNTHRAEFCIDKLYSPDTSAGRKGLVELRAFEMPPHPQMSLVQQLLVRALVARFWKSPYTMKLARWGTELHDRWTLPHFLHQDLEDVLLELRQAGFPFEGVWFAPHFEFRFPVLGQVTQRGVHLELRPAVEPWHTLGEENTGSGPVRFVDSSVERMQVKVTGLTETRHVISCNGRRVPLQATGTNGEFVAAVRYRAWQPPSCLHPTVGVNTPLVFDILDAWLGRSLGGCTYHVSHPGGRAFETFPVNANEAEGRRSARFFASGHTPGPVMVPWEQRHPECPCTLDLRQPVPAHRLQNKPPKEEVKVNGSTAPSRIMGVETH